MKKYSILFIFMHSALIAQRGGVPPEMPSMCDRSYALDTVRLLLQLPKTTTPLQLKSYEDYLILLKQFDDLLFKENAFEHGGEIDTGIMAILRYPITQYNNCRNNQAETGVITSPMCDNTYAQYMQQALSEISHTTEKSKIGLYTDYLINLKNLEDVRFQIHAFEANKTNLGILNSLRAVHTRYLGCRDFLKRTFDARTTIY